MSRPLSATKKQVDTPLVIGIGAHFRGDDEAGLLAVQELQREPGQPDAEFLCFSDDPARIISAWSGHRRVIVIDAVRSGSLPGTLHRIDVRKTGVTPRSRMSSHGDALADAIELSRALGSLPEQLVVIGIEPAATGLGDEMSKACRQGLQGLVDMARREIACMSRQ